MKLIGLQDKTIQYVIYNLSGKLTLSFPQDLRSSDILICQNFSSYKKYAREICKNRLQYKVIIFLDYIKVLENISGIQIISKLNEKFISYVNNKCTYSIPHNIRLLEDTIIEDKIKEVENGSFFTRIVYPLLYKGVKDSGKRREITKSMSLSILKCLGKNIPDIMKYKQDIKPKYLKLFLNWLNTNEAKKVCECLLTKEIKYNFDSFEINYLINNIDGEI